MCFLLPFLHQFNMRERLLAKRVLVGAARGRERIQKPYERTRQVIESKRRRFWNPSTY